MKRFLYIFSLLLAVTTLKGQIIYSVEVTSPTFSCNSIPVNVTGVFACGNATISGSDYQIAGTTIFVNIYFTQPSICLPVIIPYVHTQFLESIPPGDYTLTVRSFENLVFYTSSSVALTVDPCCAVEVILDESIILSDTYQASSQITASGSVLADSSVVFKAGDRIRLIPGFSAWQGSDFSALIVDCPASAAVQQKALVVEFKDLPRNVAVKIYPNPSDGRLTLEIPERWTGELRAIDLLDTHGRPVRQIPVPDHLTDRFDIDLSRQPRGLYLLRIRSADGVTVKRILLQ